MSLQDQANNVKGEMEEIIDGIGIDDVKAQGITVRIGGKLVKMEFTDEELLPEDEIRREYSEKLTAKLQSIKSELNEKMSEMTYMVEQAKQEYEEKEREVSRRLSTSNIMPHVTYDHAKAGLSVTKGEGYDNNSDDCLVWYYQGIYWPKTVDNRPLDPKYSKRMVSPVIIRVVTKGETITNVSVRKTIGLGKFDHYHRMGSDDCWGAWHHPSKWNDANDIISCARKALAVLENVNTGSPGTRAPSGLPRLDTLQRHIVSREEVQGSSYKTSKADERAGISAENDTTESVGGDVWST